MTHKQRFRFWLPFAFLLLGTMLPAGGSAQQATPIVAGPDERSRSVVQVADNQAEEDLDETPTGTVTRTASNLSPSQGEVVTFTSTISGTAPANTNLAVYNEYANTELQYIAFNIISTTNLSIPDMQYVDTSVLVSVEASGNYSATYQWTMEVRSGPGTVITSVTQFQDQSDTFSLSAETNQTVRNYPFTGTISSSSSTAAPAAGDLVTLTIDIAGSGNPNDALAVTSTFPSAELTVEAFRVTASSNLGTPGHLAEPGANLITGTIQSGGDYSGTFEVDLRVATTVPEGTGISVLSDLGEINGSATGSATTTLTVAADPGETDPRPTGTVTRTVSNLTPSPGEIVTFTVSISGSAPAGTGLEIDNSYPNLQLEFLSFQVTSSTNLTEPDDQDLDTQVTMSVQESGAYHAVYETRMLVTAGVGEGIVSGSQFQDEAQTFIVLSEVTQTVTAAPGEPEPTATVPPATSAPITPEPTTLPATSVPVTPGGPGLPSGQGRSGSVNTLPSTGNGTATHPDAVVLSLLGAGFLAIIAAVGVNRRTAGHR